MDLPYYRDYELAWTRSSDDERDFRRLLSRIFGTLVLLAVAWPWIPTPAIDPYEIEAIPPVIARFMLEQQAPPPPPPKPQEVEPEPEPIAEPEAEPEQLAEVLPEPEPEVAPPPPVDNQQVARERAQAALLPFTEDLAALADSDVLDKVTDDRPLTGSVGEAVRNERSMITSRAGAASASAGINTAGLSRNTGGAGLSARATTTIESPVEEVAQTAGGARRTGNSSKGSRSREEIELVFDRNKGAIFALYNRALRMDPTLQGKLVLRLTIASTGEVTFCEVVSSELANQELERKLVQRVKLFRFESRDVEAVTTTKPIDFFPA